MRSKEGRIFMTNKLRPLLDPSNRPYHVASDYVERLDTAQLQKNTKHESQYFVHGFVTD